MVRNRAAKVVLVGSPNVGKSAIFNYLTGNYVAVSNYPGTTVDISTGSFKHCGRRFEVIDTPGMYSLIPLTDEEKVTRLLLSGQTPDVVVHVIDAKNLRRMLNMTIQLIDAGLPVILNLNMIDEAQNLGMLIDIALLENLLGIPVIATSAVSKTGMEILKKTISQYTPVKIRAFKLSDEIEQSIARISSRLTGAYGLNNRITAILLLQGDNMALDIARTEAGWADIAAEMRRLSSGKDSLNSIVAAERQAIIDKFVARVVKYAAPERKRLKTVGSWLGRVTREPLTGVPILGFVLYFGLYKFVGNFGAGYLVDYINNSVFVPVINPVIELLVITYIPWEWLRSLLAGEYGIFTMGFRYAIAIILPIVGTFFLAFAVLEDTGYLPRLAMLVDSIFRYFGLNGRAVIPLTLGLGCGSMAVMVTRTLETRRERLLTTFLLSLTIPCSAQLGVVLALLSHNAVAVAVWSLFMLTVFVITGWFSAKLVPGGRSAFYMEIPPLRLPLAGNVVKKAYTRMAWYFMEILPVFLITSVVLWAGDRSGVLDKMIKYVQPAMALIGLPQETAQAFLLGFFRRDYGAAGLYDLAVAGKLSDAQLVVAAVALTLFVPCVAQFAVMVKERGIITAWVMVALISIIAFGSAFVMHNVLKLLVL
ncbi:Fe(2+) transporter FeoB [Sporomusa carbonis]|uniref:ferrous iron transport protein B n=1 Tax=Sporomusa carbonis TaxID=3076075 RepID=UPI003A6D56A6